MLYLDEGTIQQANSTTAAELQTACRVAAAQEVRARDGGGCTKLVSMVEQPLSLASSVDFVFVFLPFFLSEMICASAAAAAVVFSVGMSVTQSAWNAWSAWTTMALLLVDSTRKGVVTCT